MSNEKMLLDVLRPFASIVGKSGSPVTITIGDDTWSNALTTEHFEKAFEAVHATLAERQSHDLTR